MYIYKHLARPAVADYYC